MLRGRVLLLSATAFACRPIPAKTPRPGDAVSTGAGAGTTKASRPSKGCPAIDAEQAAGEFREGQALLETARDGEHYRGEELVAALAVLRQAAERGDVGAQSLYGSTLFAVMYLDEAPRPDQRDDYVAALGFLRIAALRGDGEARDFIPGLAELERVEGTSLRPDPPPEPLDQIPREWLLAALAMADAWLDCERQVRGVQWVRGAPSSGSGARGGILLAPERPHGRA